MLAMHAVVPGTGPWSWILTWPADPFAVAMIMGVGFVYAGGLRRLRRVGTPFPSRWALAFWCGLGALALALISPVDAYADASFSVHMAQHLLLTFVAPPLLALGAPITLALRACSAPRARSISGFLRGPLGRTLSNPLMGFTLFIGVPFAIHLSPLFDIALREPLVHRAEHAAWITAALIYWWPIVGRDPTPHPVSYPVRMLSLFVAMPLMSFLALSIYLAPAPLYPTYAALPAPWGTQALVEQQWAAVQMWLVGNSALVLAILIVAVAWKHAEDEGQRRVEARLDAVDAGPPTI
jgi:putative membrane protein